MGVSLSKGGNVSLTKEAGGTLAAVTVGLGWDARTTTGDAFDLDASSLLCNASGKVRSDNDFVYYGNLATSDGSVAHQGDNLTGEGEGDDEQIKVNLAGVTADVDKIVFSASIYEAEKRGQSFGQVRKASTETAMLFGELYRSGAEWKFRAVGQGYQSGLRGIATDFGVNIA